MREVTHRMTVSQRLSEFKSFASRFLRISYDSTIPKIEKPEVGLFRVYLLIFNQEVMDRFDAKADELGAKSISDGWIINADNNIDIPKPKCAAWNIYELKS